MSQTAEKTTRDISPRLFNTIIPHDKITDNEAFFLDAAVIRSSFIDLTQMPGAAALLSTLPPLSQEAQNKPIFVNASQEDRILFWTYPYDVNQPLVLPVPAGTPFRAQLANVTTTQNLVQPDALAAAMTAVGDRGLTRVDDETKPTYITLPDGMPGRLYAWVDPSDPDNPRRMVAILASIRQYPEYKGGKTIDVIETAPSNLLVGTDIDITAGYMLSCCAGMSAVTVLYDEAKGTTAAYVADSTNGTMSAHTRYFEAKTQGDGTVLSRAHHVTGDDGLRQLLALIKHTRREDHNCDDHAGHAHRDTTPHPQA